MRFFKLFWHKGNKKGRSDISGEWVLIKDDPDLGKAGCISMVFHPDGKLDYKIEDKGKIKVVCLTYVIEGNEIITDQPSSPKLERTRFNIDSEGILTLEYQGSQSLYKRKN